MPDSLKNRRSQSRSRGQGGRPLKLISVVGARPQFVKLAPVARAFGMHEEITHSVIHTGQHYDENMSKSFFTDLELPAPDLNLGVGSGGHAVQTAAMLVKLEQAFSEQAPSAVIVYGDTNSTLAATLAAAKIHVPVAHVEAGLRSFNRLMPEEINRLVADHCADRLYAPTPCALKNLEQESLGRRAVLTGDVMLDAVLHNIELADAKSSMRRDLGLEVGGYGLVTVHRPVNTTGPELEKLMKALEETARRHLPLVFPVHPRTRAVLESLNYRPPEGLSLISPLSYLDSIAMVRDAAMVITDSGGMQKEAAFLHTPCLTARAETEWTETVEIGVNRLVGDGGERIVEVVDQILNSESLFDDEVLKKLDENYGCGDAAGRIVEDCIKWIS